MQNICAVFPHTILKVHTCSGTIIMLNNYATLLLEPYAYNTKGAAWPATVTDCTLFIVSVYSFVHVHE